MNYLIEQARDYAYKMHDGQEYGDLPYVFHLQDVVNILMDRKEAAVPEHLIAAAWLHDIVEDTDATLFDIREQFGGKVARIVDACTDGEGKNRKERKAIAYAKLRVSGAEARAVKLADRISNMRCSIENPGLSKMYVKEFPEFIRNCGGDHINNDLLVQVYSLFTTSAERYILCR